MAIHGGNPKIHHKNMADGVAENGGCHGVQQKYKRKEKINKQKKS